VNYFQDQEADTSGRFLAQAQGAASGRLREFVAITKSRHSLCM